MNQPVSDGDAKVSADPAAARTGANPAATQVGIGNAGSGITLPENFGRYRILKKLGEGGMGAVFLAEDTRLNQRRIAIKVPTLSRGPGSDELQRFQREAGLAASLRHPNLCPVHDIGEHEGVHYISMDFIEGQPLSKYIGKKQSLRTIAVLVRKIALAMAEAHTRGIIHRDLKPENVMIDSRKEPIVMDFGLATSSGGQSTKITQSGMILGSPAYMAKEQVLGETEKYGPHTDVYALGVILYELISGKVPFEGPSVTVVLGRILANEPASPRELRPDLDESLEAICLKAMAKEIPNRYATMNEFATALSEYIKGASSPDGSLALGPGKAPTESLQKNSALVTAASHTDIASTGTTPSGKKTGRIVVGSLAVIALAGVALYAVVEKPWQKSPSTEDRPVAANDSASNSKGKTPDEPAAPSQTSEPESANAGSMDSEPDESTTGEIEPDQSLTISDGELESSSTAAGKLSYKTLTQSEWFPLVSEGRVAETRFWKLEDGVLSTTKPNRRSILNLNNFNRENLLVEAKITMPEADAEVILGVREDRDSGVRVGYTGDGTLSLMRRARGGKVAILSRWQPRKNLTGEFTLSLAAVDHDVVVFVDGLISRRFRGERMVPHAGHILLQVTNPSVRVREVRGIDLDAARKSTSQTTTPSGPPAGTPPQAGSASAAIDLLKRVSLPKDVVRGDWKFTGTALDSNFGTLDGQSRIQIPGPLPEQYRLNLEVERLGDRYFGLAVGFVLDGRQAMLEIDGFGHPEESPDDLATAISLIDGKRGDKTETVISRGKRLLPLDERRKISLEVRKNLFVFTHEGKELLRWDADPERLSLSPAWNVLDKSALILGSQAPFRIHRYTLTPLGP